MSIGGSSQNLNSGFGYGSMADDVTKCSKIFEKVQLRKVAQFIDEFVWIVDFSLWCFHVTTLVWH